MVINIVFDYDTFEIYNNAMNLIALLVGYPDRRTLFEIADQRSFVPTMLCAIFHVIVNRRNIDKRKGNRQKITGSRPTNADCHDRNERRIGMESIPERLNAKRKYGGGSGVKPGPMIMRQRDFV